MSENQLPVLGMPVEIDMDQDKANLLLKIYAAAAQFRPNTFTLPVPAQQPGQQVVPYSPPSPPVPGSFDPNAAVELTKPKPPTDSGSTPGTGAGASAIGLATSFTVLGKALSATVQVLGKVFSTALKWTLGVTALSAGSLFGYDKLAQHVSSSFNASRAMNISTGFGNAVRNVWGNKLDDSESLLAAISGAQGRPDDPAYAALKALKLNPDDDVQTNYETALASAHDFARSNQGPAARSRFNTLYGRLGLGAESYNQLRAMDDGEFSGAQKELARQSTGTNLSDSTQKSYQETVIHLQGNIDSLGAHFVEVLKTINPALMKFSDAFTNDLIKFMDGNGKTLFTAITNGLDKFATYLNSPEFLSNMQSLADGVAALSKAVVTALRILGVLPKGDSASEQGIAPSAPQDPNNPNATAPQTPRLPQGPAYVPSLDKDYSIKDEIGQFYHDPNRLEAIQKKDAIFKDAAVKYSVNEYLLKSIAKEESQGIASKVSPGNAMGVMQITRDTGVNVGLSPKNDFADFFDPIKNINAGADVLSRNLKENKGDVARALAQYNGGNLVFRPEGSDPQKTPRDPDNLYLKKETVEYLLKIIRDNNPDIEAQHPGLTRRLQDADSILHKSGKENDRVRIELTTKSKPGSDTQASVSSVRGQAALFTYQNQTVRGTA